MYSIFPYSYLISNKLDSEQLNILRSIRNNSYEQFHNNHKFVSNDINSLNIYTKLEKPVIQSSNNSNIRENLHHE